MQNITTEKKIVKAKNSTAFSITRRPFRMEHQAEQWKKLLSFRFFTPNNRQSTWLNFSYIFGPRLSLDRIQFLANIKLRSYSEFT